MNKSNITNARSRANVGGFMVSHNSMTHEVRFFVTQRWWGWLSLTNHKGLKLINEGYIPRNTPWTGW